MNILGNSINILGNKYNIVYLEHQKDMNIKEHVAECDYSKKEIRVALHDLENKRYSDAWLEDSLFHEIAHCFMYETANSDINDERTAELLSKFAMFVKNNYKT